MADSTVVVACLRIVRGGPGVPHDVTFVIPGGSVIGLLGPSG